MEDEQVNPAQAREADPVEALPARREIDREVRRGLPLATVVGVAGSLGIFLVMVALMYQFTLPEVPPADPEAKTPEQKIEALRSEDRRLLTTAAAVDATKGVYRIPIDRAMALVAQEPAKREPATPKAEVPKAEPAKEEPKVEPPKAEEPKAEPPKAEEPKGGAGR